MNKIEYHEENKVKFSMHNDGEMTIWELARDLVVLVQGMGYSYEQACSIINTDN
tara:strand:- start:647 stop:808 length:162 start_codon:yes stop_codon:yes gene_type:complete